MGSEFDKLKKKIPIDRPILVKQGRVRGNNFLRFASCNDVYNNVAFILTKS